MAQPAVNQHKLLWLQVLVANNKKVFKLCHAKDLSSFGYFQRSTVEELLVFATRTTSERAANGSRIKIALKEVPFNLHLYRRVDGLIGVAITDQNYPERVAQTLVTKLTSGFERKYESSWKKINQDKALHFPQIDSLMKEYANPNEADKMTALQQTLDEIKEIMHKNIEDMMERGEKLNELAVKSDDIGNVSQMFLKDTKRMNQCCQLY